MLAAAPKDSNVVDLMLGRVEAVTFLRDSTGIPVSVADLERSGSAYRKFGGRVLYRRDDLLDWAKRRLSPPIHPRRAAR
jgi:hypothetical protein